MFVPYRAQPGPGKEELMVLPSPGLVPRVGLGRLLKCSVVTSWNHICLSSPENVSRLGHG